MGADFRKCFKKLITKLLLDENFENIRYKSHPISKSVGAKSVLLKTWGCSCTHCTHANQGPAILQKYFFHRKTNTILIHIVRICMRGSFWYTLGNRTMSFFGLPTLFTDHLCFWWIHGMKTFRLYPNGWLVVLWDDYVRELVFDSYLLESYRGAGTGGNGGAIAPPQSF